VFAGRGGAYITAEDEYSWGYIHSHRCGCVGSLTNGLIFEQWRKRPHQLGKCDTYQLTIQIRCSHVLVDNETDADEYWNMNSYLIGDGSEFCLAMSVSAFISCETISIFTPVHTHHSLSLIYSPWRMKRRCWGGGGCRHPLFRLENQGYPPFCLLISSTQIRQPYVLGNLLKLLFNSFAATQEMT